MRETTRITMGIAGRTLFDADTFSEADEIGAALTVALRLTIDNMPNALSVGHLLVQRGLTVASKRFPTSGRLANAAHRFRWPVWLPGEQGRSLRHAVGLLEAYVQRMTAARCADADAAHLHGGAAALPMHLHVGSPGDVPVDARRQRDPREHDRLVRSVRAPPPSGPCGPIPSAATQSVSCPRPRPRARAMRGSPSAPVRACA